MMYCRHCGAEVNAGSNFCNKCGTALRTNAGPGEAPSVMAPNHPAAMPGASKKGKPLAFRAFIVVIAAVALILSYIGVSKIMNISTAARENALRARTAAAGSDSISKAPSDNKPAENQSSKETVQNFPENGSVKRFTGEDAVAPLQIATSSGEAAYYYVKLVGYDTDQDVLAIYIRAGETADVRVPLGSYEIRYAVGNTWYGDDILFGPETEYAKADRRLDFKQTSTGISGYRVELILQVNGNLATRAISREEF